MKRSSRPPAALPESFNRQLSMYALAASAAGVGLLALASTAEAKIVYTPANVQISGKPLPIDLNHDGVVDFFLFHYGFHSTPGGNALLACLGPFFQGTRTVCASWSLGPNHLNAFRVVESIGREWGAAVEPGAKIVGGDLFRSGHSADLGQIMFPSSSQKPPRWGGPWVNGGKGVKNRYVGIKFRIKGRFHFGWARITVTTTSNSFSATLTGYAYETIPRKGIIAGATKGPGNAEPAASLKTHTEEHATLGMLALGASGLSIWRREEAVPAAPEGI
jgi:hypothetical protein